MNAETPKVRFASQLDILIIPNRFDGRESPSSCGTSPPFPNDNLETRPNSHQLLRGLHVPAAPTLSAKMDEHHAGDTIDKRQRLRDTFGMLPTSPPTMQSAHEPSKSASTLEEPLFQSRALPSPQSQPRDTRELLRSRLLSLFPSMTMSTVASSVADHCQHTDFSLSSPRRIASQPESLINPDGTLDPGHLSSNPPLGKNRLQELRSFVIPPCPPPHSTSIINDTASSAIHPSDAFAESVSDSSTPESSMNVLQASVSNRRGPMDDSMEVDESPHVGTLRSGSPTHFGEYYLPRTPPRSNPPKSAIRRAVPDIPSLNPSSNLFQGKTLRDRLRSLKIPSSPPLHPTVTDSIILSPTTRPSAPTPHSPSSSKTHRANIEAPIPSPSNQQRQRDITGEVENNEIDELIDTPGQTLRRLDLKFPNRVESLRNREVRAEERLTIQTLLKSNDPVLNISEADYGGRPNDDGPTIRALSEYARLYQLSRQRQLRAWRRIIAVFDKLDELQSERDEIDNGLYSDPL
ncbi:hypothetical protein EV363DRAFT_1454339 [Boletus edulis]|nr:hypothetical protein EV363DRAFT_1454339 [Boletus edulis]